MTFQTFETISKHNYTEIKRKQLCQNKSLEFLYHCRIFSIQSLFFWVTQQGVLQNHN